MSREKRACGEIRTRVGISPTDYKTVPIAAKGHKLFKMAEDLELESKLGDSKSPVLPITPILN